MRAICSRPLRTSAIVLAAMLLTGSAYAQDTVKIAAVGARTGPMAGGAAVTHWPNIDLWVKQVNDRGGLRLKGGQRKIELITADDRSQTGDAIRAVERFATVDKADFILAPYATAFNLAAAPTFDKYGYPQVVATTITDKIPELTQRYKGIFFIQGDVTSYAVQTAEVLGELLAQGKIGNRLAMVNVADTFGIEIAAASRPIFRKAGFEFVYETSYPLGTQDLGPVIKGARAARPDVFVAWSYPPDTFGLTEQAQIEGLNVKAFYVAVGSSFPSYLQKFGSKIENVLGGGGIDAESAAVKAYYKAFKDVTGKEADYWGAPFMYSALQVVEQAIESVGSLDRAAITEHIRNTTFDVTIGKLKYNNQNNDLFWTVGQWQNGNFQAVRSTGRPGTKPVQLKTGW